ncbi:23S rRNA pseudouridine(1911/1915/1917) synthase RluD [Alteromonas sediminis]|uniref:Pseudouridine synthase n=1 Tax=Alteromonas sediminis TaxID=2259342 RepID=A0A3N5YA48_9ALTE|nr:23S rRNA pseudouridine(1911/1915/1917) synthase RluD [Alteromonas sediminis]RPJ65565.1 23S rRNA pseudouridine(1911/1915/1917) synthase RluD [Alteromonas sediminis]
MSDNIKFIHLTASAEPRHFGARLDQVLAELFSDYSRSRLKEWIQQGKVSVDDDVCTVPRQKLKGDEKIEINAELVQEVYHQAEDIDINVVFEDEHILVINKPRDVVVHPGAGNTSGTLLNALLSHVPGIEQIPRAGIVHRLDKDTTGLMVVAKSLLAQNALVEQLQSREMGREYEAICYGTMVAGGTVDAPIGRHPTKRTLMAVRELAKPAVTHYRVIEKFRAFTHLRLKLDTGRTHQIRVHMAHIKHPLVGDPAYGGRTRLPKGADEEFITCLRSFNRQALHAAQLSFFHPESGEWLTFQAPLPEDFQKLLIAVRQDSETHGIDEL